MSHISQAQIVIESLDALARAVAKKGWRFVRDQQSYKWFGRWVGDTPLPDGVSVEDLGRCDHAIQIPGCQYEIGVVATSEGYALRYDYWDRNLSAAIGGANADVLRQAYGVERMIQVAEERGMSVRQHVTSTGEVMLEVE